MHASKYHNGHQWEHSLFVTAPRGLAAISWRRSPRQPTDTCLSLPSIDSMLEL